MTHLTLISQFTGRLMAFAALFYLVRTGYLFLRNLAIHNQWGGADNWTDYRVFMPDPWQLGITWACLSYLAAYLTF